MILDTNALSAVVLGEYRFGAGQSRRRAEYKKWLRALIAATRVLALEEETSRHYAGIRAALKRPAAPSLATISGSLRSAGNTVYNS